MKGWVKRMFSTDECKSQLSWVQIPLKPLIVLLKGGLPNSSQNAIYASSVMMSHHHPPIMGPGPA